jgi:hypothetical protein
MNTEPKTKGDILAERIEKIIDSNLAPPVIAIRSALADYRRPLPACYAIFTGKGGYPAENAKANAAFVIGNRYVITSGTMGQSSTSLMIEGVEGSWNSVMFDYDEKSAPIENHYGSLKFAVSKPILL